ncbi:DNA cytosine methyltransferase [Hymenobacter pini]|uniref:DNA cytosine methyltransferase n=1 Tax=Hymenobacter pini TaxID=2880879 RepID=UPI001CF15A8A|nr:DNA cytosine methyltransferase [Hymenobacter pini]MCA8830510.1 DNA cytosine methyltransferase [Hymenobacter pini]
MLELSVVDVFAGAGGFSEGFRLAGYEVRACVEIDKWAAQTLRRNFPKATIIEEDIRKVSTREKVRALVGQRPDVIIGGPPCQGFSMAGPVKNPNDPRNSLFNNFASWVDALRPSVFVLENVYGLLYRANESGEQVIDVIRRTFQDLEYHVTVWQLNAAQYGVPQLRQRVFIVGSLAAPIEQPPRPTHYLPVAEGQLRFDADLLPPVTVWDALSDLPQISAGEGADVLPSYGMRASTPYQRWARRGSRKVYNHEAMKHTKRLVERFRLIQSGTALAEMEEQYRVFRRGASGELSAATYSSNYRHLRPGMVSYTIPASFYSTFIHPTLPRNLTAREAARLQSFPDTYVFCGKRTQVSSKLLKSKGREDENYLSQYNQVGNAVPPLLSMAIAQHVQAHIEQVMGTTCEVEMPAVQPELTLAASGREEIAA